MNQAQAKSTDSKQDWQTPPELVRAVERKLGIRFTLDVCAHADNHQHENYFTIADDGLTQDWGTHVCWMNPPYANGEIIRWMGKAVEAARAGAEVVALVPNSTDTRWFRYCWFGELYFLTGRVNFLGEEGNGPAFGNVVVHFQPGLPPIKRGRYHLWDWKKDIGGQLRLFQEATS